MGWVFISALNAEQARWALFGARSGAGLGPVLALVLGWIGGRRGGKRSNPMIQ